MKINHLVPLFLLLGCDPKDDETGEPEDTSEPAAADADADGFDATEDCDDSAASINPGAEEICDGIDNNCDGQVDEGVTTTYYSDADGDGYGDEASATDACSAPSGTIEVAGDCDDENASISPDGKEVCDEADNNCDGFVDEFVTETFYLDADGDGYGDPKQQTEACEAPSGYTADYTDCDDTDAALSPGATETCDGIDTDCDLTTTDEGTASMISGGTLTDLTADFAAASASSPLSMTLADGDPDAEIRFCGGTFYANISLLGAGDLSLVGASGDSVLSGGSTHAILVVDSDVATLDVSGLTLSDGSSDFTGTANSSYKVGGALACQGAATVNLTDVLLANNTAGLGGAIYLDRCTINLSSAVLSGNAATFGGAIFAAGGTLDILDSELSGNEADWSGGAVALDGGYGSDIAMILTDSLVTGNTGYYGGGFNIYTSSSPSVTAECIGSSKLDAGFTANTATYGGGFHMEGGGAGFEAVDCDFGEKSDDNDPSDVSLDLDDATYDDLGSDETFSCDESSCQ